MGTRLRVQAHTPIRQTFTHLLSQRPSPIAQPPRAQILNDMSEEITTRVSAIDTATTAADQNLAADKAEKLKWQVDVVNLSNEADKETAAANAADLVREQLAGVNSVKEAAYNDQADNYEDDMAQYAEEIEGVNQIVDVIQQLVDSC